MRGLTRRRRDRWLRLHTGVTLRRDRTNEDVEDGREDQAEKRHAEHPREYRGAERLAHLSSGSGCEYQRHNSEDEGERRHQNRTQPGARGFDRRIEP
jgi:hypothetical protein